MTLMIGSRGIHSSSISATPASSQPVSNTHGSLRMITRLLTCMVGPTPSTAGQIANVYCHGLMEITLLMRSLRVGNLLFMLPEEVFSLIGKQRLRQAQTLIWNFSRTTT